MMDSMTMGGNSMSSSMNMGAGGSSMDMGGDKSMPGMMMPMYMMHMTFYQSNELTILFKGINSNGSNG